MHGLTQADFGELMDSFQEGAAPAKATHDPLAEISGYGEWGGATARNIGLGRDRSGSWTVDPDLSRSLW